MPPQSLDAQTMDEHCPTAETISPQETTPAAIQPLDAPLATPALLSNPEETSEPSTVLPPDDNGAAEIQPLNVTPEVQPLDASPATSEPTATIAPEPTPEKEDIPSHTADSSSVKPAFGNRLLKRVLWGGLFAGTAAVSAVAGATLSLALPLPTWLTPHHAQAIGLGELWQNGFRYQITRPVNLLLMGIDEVPDVPKDSQEVFTGRTDTLLLVRVDPEKHTTSLLSIPRDTRVRIPNYGVAKINHANVEGGPELVAQTINANLANVPIDRYVRVSTGAFREIVDLVGGVEVFVPKRMVYEDRTQGLYIDLQPGWQTLNGSQAEQFARFRKDETGDIGRVQRQQMLLKALRQRLTSPTVIPKLPQIIRVLQRYIDTNLSVEEMLALANFALGLETDDLQMVMLPGRFSEVMEYNASYWIADWKAGSRIMQDFFQAGPVASQDSSTAVATLADHQGQPTTHLSIAIQNASGSPEVARAVARHLQDQGFYNVYVTPDWPAVEPQTQVIAQRGDIDSANALESALGIGRVVSDSTGDLQSDITIRIGEDWLEHATVEPLPTSQ
ncbi:MAG TPA: LCP family protein [Trichocoleus sp.]